MQSSNKNQLLENPILPVDIVLAPPWWYRHAGITFDPDFFYHPARRVEVEQQMENVLYERWGRYGLGADKDEKRPEVGAVHLAAGFMLSEMLGCEVEYKEDQPPTVLPAAIESLEINPDDAFTSPAWKRFETLSGELKKRHGHLTGDVNWGGILNVALDLRGEMLFMDMFDKPGRVHAFLKAIADVTERFVDHIQTETGTSSISVNRVVKQFDKPVWLHSECSHTMISNDNYEDFLMTYDAAWAESHRPFGIHYCGEDPHRYAEIFAKLPHLDFLDVGWGGDVKELRRHLPDTFLNIRLSPVEIVKKDTEEIKKTVAQLVRESGNPWLTGVCCINMDDKVADEQVAAVFEAVETLRNEFGKA